MLPIFCIMVEKTVSGEMASMQRCVFHLQRGSSQGLHSMGVNSTVLSPRALQRAGSFAALKIVIAGVPTKKARCGAALSSPTNRSASARVWSVSGNPAETRVLPEPKVAAVAISARSNSSSGPPMNSNVTQPGREPRERARVIQFSSGQRFAAVPAPGCRTRWTALCARAAGRYSSG